MKLTIEETKKIVSVLLSRKKVVIKSRANLVGRWAKTDKLQAELRQIKD
jgi:hypothetical protein